MHRFEGIFERMNWEDMAASLGITLGALLAGMVIYHLLFFILFRLAHRAVMSRILIERLRRPGRVLAPLLAIMLVGPSLAFSAEILRVVQQILSLCFITAITWLIINTILAGRDITLSRYHPDTDLKSRSIHTQLTMIVKVIIVIVVMISAATMLMTFEKIRQVGVSILASAGIIGIILGFAAQRSIATLFAGLQIGLAQPIRINDQVVVEGEFGSIEEITLIYVVVKTWDLRRLVVPVTYFLEKPFQNWSRTSAELLGTIFFNADYTVPVEEIREKLHAILQESDKWDKRAWGLQVTNSGERTLELRALVSAADASKLWDLRCEVREKLLAFLHQSYPESLPKIRAESRTEQAPVQNLPLPPAPT